MNGSNLTTKVPQSLGNITVTDFESMESSTSSPVPFVHSHTPDTFIVSAVHENHSGIHGGGSSTSNDSLNFILIPLLVILSVAFFSGLTIYCIQRRSRLDNLRHTLIPLYTFTRQEDDWGVLMLDDQGRNHRRSHR